LAVLQVIGSTANVVDAALLAIVLFIMIETKSKRSIVISAGVSAAYLAYLPAHWAVGP
jgi:hypothetical protein